eukprot:8886467-Pyramimonas_sp.AAC.2
MAAPRVAAAAAAFLGASVMRVLHNKKKIRSKRGVDCSDTESVNSVASTRRRRTRSSTRRANGGRRLEGAQPGASIVLERPSWDIEIRTWYLSWSFIDASSKLHTRTLIARPSSTYLVPR